MVNPFDRNFMKFFIGFVFILLASFALLYLVNFYQDSLNNQAAVTDGR